LWFWVAMLLHCHCLEQFQQLLVFVALVLFPHQFWISVKVGFWHICWQTEKDIHLLFSWISSDFWIADNTVQIGFSNFPIPGYLPPTLVEHYTTWALLP
jgi:hypothetical protein